MRIPGSGRIRNYITSMQNHLSATAIILLYHRVTQNITDPQRLTVSSENFDQQLQVLKRLTQPVPLNDIPHLLKKRPRSAPMLSAITFDDGYTDNLFEAAPILRRYGIPATVYVTTATVNRPHELWWDNLDRMLLRDNLPEELTLLINGQPRTWVFGTERPAPWDVYDEPSHPAHQAYLDLANIIRERPPEERNHIIQQLHAWSDQEVAPRPDHQTMTEEELRQLTADGLITIGAHTVNHPVLASLAPEQQKQEILQSRTRLEEILHQPITTFSYPYGRIEDYNRQTIRIVRQAHFSTCCSNFPGRTNRYTDPHQLPRFIAGNWDASTFESHCNSWMKR